MPLYEYKCQRCGYRFEKLVFGNEEIKCPKCKSKDVKKLLSTFSIGGNKGPGNKSGGCSQGTCPICKG